MLDDCRATAVRAIGREITDNEWDGMKKYIRDATYRYNKEQNTKSPTYDADSDATILAYAKEAYMNDKVNAYKNAVRSARQINDTQKELDKYVAGRGNRLQGFLRMMMGSEMSVRAANTLLHAQISNDSWEYMQSPKALAEIAKVVIDKAPASSPEVAKAAKEISASFEMGNQYRKAYGLNIHMDDDWGLPQYHDWLKIANVSKDQFINDTLPRLNLNRYLHSDGTKMDVEADIKPMLGRIYDTFSTDGASQGQTSLRGQPHSALDGGTGLARQLWFKDSDSYLAHMDQYGKGINAFDMVSHHLGGIARDIGMSAVWGKNARDNAYNLMVGAKEADMQASDLNGKKKTNRVFNRVNRYYDAMFNPSLPGNETVAKAGEQIRGFLSATHLGAMVSAIPDYTMMMVASHTMGISPMRMFAQNMKYVTGTKEGKEYARNLGIYLDTFNSTFNEGAIGHLKDGQWGTLLNSAVHRMMGMVAIDRGQTVAAHVLAMDKIGEVADKMDYATAMKEAPLLKEAGIDEHTYALYQAARQARKAAGQPDDDVRLTVNDIDRIPPEELMKQAAIKNADVAKALGGQIDKANANVARILDWGASAQEKAQARIEALQDRLDAFLDNADVKRGKGADVLNAKKEMLQAKADKAQTLHDILLMYRTGKFDFQTFKQFADVQDGMDINVDAMEKRSSKFADATDNQARQLGMKLGNLNNQVRQATAKFNSLARELDNETFKRIAETNDMGDKINDELEKTLQGHQDKLDRLFDLTSYYERGVEDSLGEEMNRLQVDAKMKLMRAASVFSHYAARGASGSTVAERTMLGGSAPAGTVMGELTSTLMQMKSIPIGMLREHWMRMMQQDGWMTRGQYAARFAAAAFLGGAMSQQAAALKNGQDPENMNPMTAEGRLFALKAMMRGGVLGPLGDLMTPQRNWQSSSIADLLGPGGSVLNDAYKIFQGVGNDVNLGEAPDAAIGKAVGRFATQHLIPGSKLWYLNAAYNRMVTDNLQEALVPGTLARRNAQFEKDGVGHWWGIGQPLPDRAPNFERAIASDQP